jgi:DNA-binding transcriptional LysR family regulator
MPWSFRQDGKPIEVPTQGGFTCLEEYLSMITLACNGAGVVQTYRFTVEKELASGELVELLPQHGGTTRPFILLYPHARHVALRVRTFIEFLTTKLAQRV